MSEPAPRLDRKRGHHATSRWRRRRRLAPWSRHRTVAEHEVTACPPRPARLGTHG